MASPGIRRLLLAVHVIGSVGWIGAAAAYLALGSAATIAGGSDALRAAWAGMEVIGWWVCVPLGVLAWLSGVILSIVTRWGLLKHYWVVFALVLTTLALLVMLFHMPAVTAGALVARTGDDDAVQGLGGDLLHPAVGLVVLVVVAVLNLYKPRGLTPYGARSARPTVAATP